MLLLLCTETNPLLLDLCRQHLHGAQHCHEGLNMTAMVGTCHRPCQLAKAGKLVLLQLQIASDMLQTVAKAALQMAPKPLQLGHMVAPATLRLLL